MAVALAAAGAGPALAAGAPSPVAGSIGIRLLDAPLAARDDPRAQLSIVDQVTPGTVLERRVEVSNGTGSHQQLSLYAAAATIGHGSFLGSAGHTPDDLSTWTSVSPGRPDVPAGGTTTALVRIAVPADAAPGEQYAVVWAETRSPSPPGGGVVQVNRVGIRLYVSVGGTGARAADFTIESLTAERSPGGLPVVVAGVRNSGGRALDMSGSLALADGPGGLRAGPFPAGLGVTLAIADAEPVRVTLSGQVPAGPWLAQITLRSGLVVRTATATITFPSAGAARAVPTDASRSWWIYAAGVALVVLPVLLASWVLRRRPRSGSAGAAARR